MASFHAGVLRLSLALPLFVALATPAAPVCADERTPPGPDRWSSAFERFLAHRYTGWQIANDGGDAEPNRQFIIVCDPENLGSYLRSLGHLSTLRDEYLRSPEGWSAGKESQYPCISTNSFRLPRHSGCRAAQPSDDENPVAHGACYEVIADDPSHQVVELRFRDLDTGIYDSFFKYEIRAGRVVPLESWVASRGVMPMLFAELTLVSLLLLMVCGMFLGFRFLRSRHQHGSH
jgi:hypothetical protein